MSLCDTCADCVGGLCKSLEETARARHGASVRDQWEVESCEDWRERSKRDRGVDLAARFGLMTAKLHASEEWSDDDRTPEQHLQARADDAAKAWKHHAALVPDAELCELFDLCDPEPLHKRLIRLIVDCPELDKARGRRYRLTWRTTRWQVQGSPCWGSSKPIPQPQREKFHIEESWEIILSLPVWMLLDESGRDRLLHHQLMHAASAAHGHPVAEWPETVHRYGLATKDQALLALAGIAHESARKRVEIWGLLPNGQTQLFASKGVEQIEVVWGRP